MTAHVFALVVLLAASLQAQVTFDRILHPEKEPQNWLSYSGSLFNQRFSPLTQITTVNVKNLELQWIWQAKSLEKYEATSIVVDGVLYTVQAPNDVVALDAVTGRLLSHDTFTVQLLDTKEQLRSFMKSDLRDFGFAPSPMPSFKARLNAQEIADVVSYLVTLKDRTAQ